MAIAPVSNVSFRSNYNQVNFEGKKKEKSSGLHVTNSIKVIPLATLLALSPLNNVEAGAQAGISSNSDRTEMVHQSKLNTFNRADVIEYKDFNYNGFDIRVNLVKNKENPSLKNIWMEWEHGMNVGGSGVISKLNHIKYNIKGEDGCSAGNVIFDAVYLNDKENIEHSHSFSNPDLCSYVNRLIKNNQTSVVERNVTLNLSPATSGWVVSGRNINTDWIEQARNSMQRWGTQIGFWQVDTNNGKYKIFAYNTDDNKDDFEQLAIEKEGGPLLQVKGLVGGLASFKTIDNDIKDVDLYQINVKKGNVGVHAIYNQQLWEFLAALYQHQRNNNSVEAFDAHYRYSILENGSILASEIN